MHFCRRTSKGTDANRQQRANENNARVSLNFPTCERQTVLGCCEEETETISSWQLLTLRESNNCSTKNSLLLTSSLIFQSNGFYIRKPLADFHLRTIEESCSPIAALEKVIVNLSIEGQSIIGTQLLSESNKDSRNCILLFARHFTSLDSTIYKYNGGHGSSFPNSRRRRGIFGEFLYPLSSARHALYIRVVSQTDSAKRGNKQ